MIEATAPVFRSYASLPSRYTSGIKRTPKMIDGTLTAKSPKPMSRPDTHRMEK